MDRYRIGEWIIPVCGGSRAVMVVDYPDKRRIRVALKNRYGMAVELTVSPFGFRRAKEEEIPDA